MLETSELSLDRNVQLYISPLPPTSVPSPACLSTVMFPHGLPHGKVHLSGSLKTSWSTPHHSTVCPTATRISGTLCLVASTAPWIAGPRGSVGTLMEWFGLRFVEGFKDEQGAHPVGRLSCAPSRVASRGKIQLGSGAFMAFGGVSQRLYNGRRYPASTSWVLELRSNGRID